MFVKRLLFYAVFLLSVFCSAPPVLAQCFCGSFYHDDQSVEHVHVAKPIQKPPKKTLLQPFEEQVAALINVERARYGRAPFSIDEQGSLGARQHSVFMSQNGLIHANGYMECIAMAGGSPEYVVALWMASPPHQAIILANGSILSVGSYGAWHTIRVR